MFLKENILDKKINPTIKGKLIYIYNLLDINIIVLYKEQVKTILLV